MKCPNCGNENPPDYVFCDECGARLQGDDAGVVNQPSDASSEDAVLAGTGMSNVSSVGTAGNGNQQESSQVGYTGYSAMGTPAYTGTDPEAPTAQYSTGGSPAASGNAQGSSMGADSAVSGNYSSLDNPISGAGVTGVAETGNGTATQGEYDGAATGVSNTGTGAGAYEPDQDSANLEVPVTEDTIQSYDAGAGTGQQSENVGWPAAESSMEQGADSGSSLPGVTPINTQEQDHNADAASTIYAPAETGDVSYADMNAGTGVDAAMGAEVQGSQAAWSGEALRHFDNAQQALSSDDWVGFGRGMAELRSYLTGLTGAGGSSASLNSSATPKGTGPISQPAAPAVVSVDSGYSSPQVESAPASSAYDSSRQATSQDGGSSTDATQNQDYTGGAQQNEATVLEPAAEAGTLPAPVNTNPGTSGDISHATSPEAGYTPTEQPSAIDHGGAETGVGEAADAIGAVGMAGGVSAPTTGSGTSISNNGASENAMARLVIISTGAELPLPDQEEITVGREDPSSGIFPDVDLTPYGGEEGGVSRRHSRLLYVNGEYFVEDLQSTNFTKLDGQRLPAHVRERLEDGARIDFGRVATIFRKS